MGKYCSFLTARPSMADMASLDLWAMLGWNGRCNDAQTSKKATGKKHTSRAGKSRNQTPTTKNNCHQHQLVSRADLENNFRLSVL